MTPNVAVAAKDSVPMTPTTPGKTAKVKPREDPAKLMVQIPGTVFSVQPVTAIPWQSSYDAASQIAVRKDRPFVCFFCDSATYQLAGGGPDAWEKYRKEKGSIPLRTVFELKIVVQAFANAGLCEFVKIVDVPANADRFKKYGVFANSLVICAPNGDSLAVFSAQKLNQTNVTQFLDNKLDASMNEWRNEQQIIKDREAVALKAKAKAQAQALPQTQEVTVQARAQPQAGQAGEVLVRARPVETPSAASVRASDVKVEVALTELAEHLAKLDDCAKSGWIPIRSKDNKDVLPSSEVNFVVKTLFDLGADESMLLQSAAFIVALSESKTRATELLAVLNAWTQAGIKSECVGEVYAEYKRLVGACAKLKKK